VHLPPLPLEPTREEMPRPAALPPLAAEVRQIRALLPQEHASSRPDSQERNIQVLCRFRGQSEAEEKRGGQAAWDIQSGCHGTVSASDGGTTGSLEFSYDRVFGPESQQSDIYDAVVPIVNEVLNGINGAVLCYGQTSAGKTFTMEGMIDEAENLRGIIPRSLATLFTEAGRVGTVRVHVSMMEIYMERLRDLLNPDGGAELRIVEDRLRGVTVHGLSEFVVSSFEQALEVFRCGQRQRAVATTGMNDRSSRSHSIFVIKVERNDGVRSSFGKLCLVDLAGSECLKKCLRRGKDAAAANADIVEESKAINQSLSTLSMVINRLADRRRNRYEPHVPYRSSKLTHVLKDVIGGNSQTVLVINCSIASLQVAETISTLRFGSCAGSVVNTLPSQQGDESLLLQTLRAARCEIERLRAISAIVADPTIGLTSVDACGYLSDLPSPIDHQSSARRSLLSDFERRSVSPQRRSPRRSKEARSRRRSFSLPGPSSSLPPSAPVSPLVLSPRSGLPSRRTSTSGAGNAASQHPSRAVSGRPSRSAAASAALSRRVSMAQSEAQMLSPLDLTPAGSRRVSQSRRPSVLNALANRLSNTLEFSPSLATSQQQVDALQGMGLSTASPLPSTMDHHRNRNVSSWEYPLAKQETKHRVIMIAELEVEKLHADLDEQQARYTARLEELQQHCVGLQAEVEWLTAERVQHLEHAVRSSFQDSSHLSEDAEDMQLAAPRALSEPALEPGTVLLQRTEVLRLQTLEVELATAKQELRVNEELAERRLAREQQAAAQAAQLSAELEQVREAARVGLAEEETLLAASDMPEKGAASAQDAETKVAEMNAELASLREQCSAHATDAGALAKAEIRNVALVQELEDLRREQSNQEARAASAAEAEEQASTRASQLASELEAARSQNLALSSEVASRAEELQDLRTKLSMQEKRADSAIDAEAKVEQLTGEIAAVRDSAIDAEAKNEQLTGEIAAVRAQCSVHATDAAALVKELEDAHRQQSIQAARAAEAQEQASKRVSELAAELQAVRSQNSELSTECASAAEQLQETLNQLSAQEANAAAALEAEAQMAQLREELADLHALNSAHVRSAAVTEEELKGLRKQLSDNFASVTEAESSMAHLDDVEAELAQVRERYEDLRAVEVARADAAALNAKELATLREQQTEHVRAVAAAEQAKARAAILAQELEDLRVEHSAQSVSAAAISDELNSLRVQHSTHAAAAAAEAAAAEAFKAQLAEELEEVRGQYLLSTTVAASAAEEQARAAQLAAELEALREQYSNQAAAVTAASQAKREAELMVTQLTEQLAHAGEAEAMQQASNVMAADEEIATREAKSQQLAAEVAELKRQHLVQEAAVAAACQAQTDAETQVASLTEQLKARRRRSLETRSMAESEQMRSAQFAAELDELRDQCSQQAQAVDAATQAKLEAEAAVAHLTEQLASATQAKAFLEASHATAADEIATKEAKTEQLAADLEGLRVQYTHQEASLAAACQAKADAESRATSLADQLAARRRRSLEAKVLSLRDADATAANCSSDSSPQDLKSQTLEQKTEIERLQAALANANALLAIQSDRAAKAEEDARVESQRIETLARASAEAALANTNPMVAIQADRAVQAQPPTPRNRAIPWVCALFARRLIWILLIFSLMVSWQRPAFASLSHNIDLFWHGVWPADLVPPRAVGAVQDTASVRQEGVQTATAGGHEGFVGGETVWIGLSCRLCVRSCTSNER